MKPNSQTGGMRTNGQEAIPSRDARVQLAGEPSEAEIQQRAYEIYVERGGTHGEDLNDWLQAEQEMKAKYRAV